jgi:hypothetical protein
MKQDLYENLTIRTEAAPIFTGGGRLQPPNLSASSAKIADNI